MLIRLQDCVRFGCVIVLLTAAACTDSDASGAADAGTAAGSGGAAGRSGAAGAAGRAAAGSGGQIGRAGHGGAGAAAAGSGGVAPGLDAGADDNDAAVGCEGEVVADQAHCLQDDAFCYPIGDGRYCTGPSAPLQHCGARAGDSCKADEYCAYQPGALCGAADAEATCQKRPRACTGLSSPVCGCDQKTYPSACQANLAGVGVYTAEACK